MKRFLAIVIAIYSPALFAQTTTESVKAYEHNIIEYRFVGLTPETTDGFVSSGNGTIGVAAMHRLCQKSYGNEARASTIHEAYFRNEKHEDKRSAWIAPSGPMLLVPYISRGYTYYVPLDASTGTKVGRELASEYMAMTGAYCRSYTQGYEDASTDGSQFVDGPVSSSGGTITSQDCGTNHAIACSIPVRITATGLTKVTNGKFEK